MNRLAGCIFGLSTLTMIGSGSANSADLAGDCCADLEERIAELEATTARKGNRKVSLMVSGQVNKAITAWDDGFEKDAYVVDNDFAQSRIRFQGKAEVAKGWEMGYWLEFGLDSASSDSVSQIDPDATAQGATAGNAGIELRPARWYIKSEQYGQLWVGRGSTSQDNLYKWANLGRAYSDAELHYNGRFILRRADGAMGMSGTSATAVTRIWDDVANNLDLSRTTNVRYDTPTIAGFMLSGSYNPGISDAALRYTEKFGTFTVNWGIGYLSDTDTSGFDRRSGLPIVPGARGNETKDIVGSAGFLEQDSGLYVYSAFGWRKFDDQGFTNVLGRQDDYGSYWYVQTGINRDYFSFGSTNLHVDVGQYDDWLSGNTIFFGPDRYFVLGSNVTRWGFGVTQAVKSAEMDFYAVFNHYSLDLDTAQIGPGNTVVNTSDETQMKDWMGLTAGARINF
ncbi:MAG: hypothetical protein MUC37_07100 [Hyphomicrobium sp.]|nr:hypothetical protein [Hyphomicrobium sp.]